MRRIIKSIAVIFLALLLVTSISPASQIKLRADAFTDAEEISVNTEYSGNVTDGYNDQKNTYKFTLYSAGYVQTVFSHPRQDHSKDTWEVILYNESYSQIHSTIVKGNYASTTTAAIGLAAGTYYIRVQSPDYFDAVSSDTYSFVVKYKASGYWEKEFNDSFTKANKIKLNKAYSGTIRDGYNDEKDYYSFKLSKPGYVTLSLSHPRQSTTAAYWTVILYNSNYEEIYRTEVYGNTTKKTLPQIGLGKGTYYVCVQSPDYFDSQTYSIYKLKVGYKKSSYWEREFNDGFITANKIKLGKTYCGSTIDGYNDEADYFYFKAAKKGTYNINLKTKRQSNTGSYWKITLYDENYQEIDNTLVYGNKTSTTLKTTLKKGTYFIKIDSTDYFDALSTSTWKLKVKKK